MNDDTAWIDWVATKMVVVILALLAIMAVAQITKIRANVTPERLREQTVQISTARSCDRTGCVER